jgi:hypothetical protein
MQNSYAVTVRLICLWLSVVFLTNCGSLKSQKKDGSEGAGSGEKLHLKISPEEAIVILDEVAAQNGWQVVSAGDQYDMQGLRGKYFRVETIRFIGGRKSFNGVFFGESGGSYVVVGKSETGLPEDLVSPFLAAVAARQGAAEGS